MTARILYRNGCITSPSAPEAAAMAVQDGRITWIGDDRSSAHFADNADRVVDLAGAVVTPAFVDAHAHLAHTGLADAGVDLRAATSREDVLDRAAAHVRTHDDTVVIGRGWDEEQWPDTVLPTREELDRACGGLPVYLARIDQHSAIVSSALAGRMVAVNGLAGWSDNGRVERDAHHAARAAVDGLLSNAMRTTALRSALRSAAAQGIGCVHELGAPHINPVEDFDLIRALAEVEALPTVLGYWGAIDALDVAREYSLLGLAGDLCADGAIGSRTAAMTGDYIDCAGHTGHVYLERGEVRDHVVACTRAGIQAGFHVIGEQAMGNVVGGLQDAADVVGADALTRARHRLEHVEMVSADQIAVLARLGVLASVQPAFDTLWGHPGGLYETRLGDRAAAMNPFGSLAAAGVSLAFGSDSPVTPFDPWGSVRAAVWHHDPRERMTTRGAFAAHTLGGWLAAGVDDAGVLAPGAAATFAVWDVAGRFDDDPGHELPSCLATVVDGRTIHDRAGVSA